MYAAIWRPGEILQQIYIYIFGRVPLWLCEDITACYMYCYFRNNLKLESA